MRQAAALATRHHEHRNNTDVITNIETTLQSAAVYRHYICHCSLQAVLPEGKTLHERPEFRQKIILKYMLLCEEIHWVLLAHGLLANSFLRCNERF